MIICPSLASSGGRVGQQHKFAVVFDPPNPHRGCFQLEPIPEPSELRDLWHSPMEK